MKAQPKSNRQAQRKVNFPPCLPGWWEDPTFHDREDVNLLAFKEGFHPKGKECDCLVLWNHKWPVNGGWVLIDHWEAPEYAYLMGRLRVSRGGDWELEIWEGEPTLFFPASDTSRITVWVIKGYINLPTEESREFFMDSRTWRVAPYPVGLMTVFNQKVPRLKRTRKTPIGRLRVVE
jgi:hypothetical protein